MTPQEAHYFTLCPQWKIVLNAMIESRRNELQSKAIKHHDLSNFVRINASWNLLRIITALGIVDNWDTFCLRLASRSEPPPKIIYAPLRAPGPNKP